MDFIAWYVMWGAVAMMIGLCAAVVKPVNYFSEPFYFSPVSLSERTDLNALGIVVMTAVHFVVNPIYCIGMTLYYCVCLLCCLVYVALHN